MNLMWSASWLVQGLVAGVVTLAILAVRAAIEGGPGVEFGDLWTSLAVGLAVGIVPYAIAKVTWWRMRRTHGAVAHQSTTFPMHREPSEGQPRGRRVKFTGGMDRFDRFTDRVLAVLTYAQDEAQRFNHNYIGTEHILLGLIREGDGTAARVLENMNVELPKVRTAVEFIIGRGDRPVVGEVGLTPHAKRVIELAIDEARRFDHQNVGTEHLLLGLVREGDGIAAGILESLGVNLDRTRAEVVRVIASGNDPG